MTTRNWFARHKILTAIGAVAVVGIIATAAGGSSGSNKTDTSVQDPLTVATTPPPAAHAPTKSAAPAKPNDKGWVVQSLRTKNDGLGDFGGTARITNTNEGAMTATFTITLSRNGAVIATLQGSANSVAPGKTVTVDLISEDKYSRGRYSYDFQTDTSY